MLQQQISEDVRPIHQAENTAFNNDVKVTNKCNVMKYCVKDINTRSSKDKTSKYQSSSKLMNDKQWKICINNRKNKHSIKRRQGGNQKEFL